MKKLLIATVASALLGLSPISFAGDWDRYDRRHYSRDYDRHYGQRHWKGNGHYYGKRHYGGHHYRKHYGGHHYRGRDRVIIHKHYRDDDAYKWLGGIYLINEILHHNHY